MIFNANFYAGLLAFYTIPIYYLVSRQQAIRLGAGRRTIRTLRENKSQEILNILESIPVIKSFLRENIEETKQMELQNSLTSAQLKIRKTSFLFDAIKTFIEQIGTVTITIPATYFVLDGQMTVGAFMFHILLFNNVMAPIRQLHWIYDQMNEALIYSEGFFQILNADNQVESSGTYVSEKITGRFDIVDLNFTILQTRCVRFLTLT